VWKWVIWLKTGIVEKSGKLWDFMVNDNRFLGIRGKIGVF
jgi:hypothetical protein